MCVLLESLFKLVLSIFYFFQTTALDKLNFNRCDLLTKVILDILSESEICGKQRILKKIIS